MFQSDRTCCVCRIPGKRVQIHHIDEDPANHDAANLAVLCFDCHDQTQVRGGFGRKLDAAQIIEFRDDWHRRVVRRRDSADEVASGRAIGLQIGGLTVAQTRQTSSYGDERGEAELHQYVRALPAVKGEAYRRAIELWVTGVTSNQIQGCYDVTDVLTQALVHLAGWYPPGHFGDGAADEYISSLISSRYAWHRAVLEPEGAGKGGTIVGPVAANLVLEDVDAMVVDIVRSLTMCWGSPEDVAAIGFDYDAWLVEWRRAKQRLGVVP